MERRALFVIVLVLCIVHQSFTQYAGDYPHKKYGFNRESSQSDADGARVFKNNLRGQDGRHKSNLDKGLTYHIDSNQNEQDFNQVKKGSSTDNLTHVQGEDTETDKSHKRKHIKSGFTNSYHKDENGSKSSFYEDSDDVGGKTVYDKRHGTRGDQQEQQFADGQRNGVSKDRYDDRRTGYNNRDLQDQQRYHIDNQGKNDGYADNYEGAIEIERRPYNDYNNNHRSFPAHRPLNRNNRLDRLDRIDRHDDQYDQYDPQNHWGYNERLPEIQRGADSHGSANRDFQTRRKITIYEDPRDDFGMNHQNSRGGDRIRERDNGQYMTRSEVTRRFDYGPMGGDDRTPLRLRYRGSK